MARGPIGVLSDDQSTLGSARLKPRRGIDDVADRHGFTCVSADGDDRVSGIDGRAGGEIEPVRAVELVQALQNG